MLLPFSTPTMPLSERRLLGFQQLLLSKPAFRGAECHTRLHRLMEERQSEECCVWTMREIVIQLRTAVTKYCRSDSHGFHFCDHVFCFRSCCNFCIKNNQLATDAAFADKAVFNARAYVHVFGNSVAWERTTGPNIVAPPTYCGARFVPIRARTSTFLSVTAFYLYQKLRKYLWFCALPELTFVQLVMNHTVQDVLRELQRRKLHRSGR